MVCSAAYNFCSRTCCEVLVFLIELASEVAKIKWAILKCCAVSAHDRYLWILVVMVPCIGLVICERNDVDRMC